MQSRPRPEPVEGRPRAPGVLRQAQHGVAGRYQWQRARVVAPMLFMVIESFKSKDPKPIGERFKRMGRMMPEGVVYHASWIDPAAARCFQVMEADSVAKLEDWASRWTDLADFEIAPVLGSQEYWAAQETQKN